MTDEGFLDKINGPFIWLTSVILCHSLRGWWTDICIDNVAFTRATSSGKKSNVYWQVSKVSGCPNSPGIRTLLKTASTGVGSKVS